MERGSQGGRRRSAPCWSRTTAGALEPPDKASCDLVQGLTILVVLLYMSLLLLLMLSMACFVVLIVVAVVVDVIEIFRHLIVFD